MQAYRHHCFDAIHSSYCLLSMWPVHKLKDMTVCVEPVNATHILT